MEDKWDFKWMGKGVATLVGDARLIKQHSTVTMIPTHTHAKYNMPAWELKVTSAPDTAFTTTTSLNKVNYGFYAPDKNYFFPVILQTANGPITDIFYLFLNTDGKFLGLFTSEQALLNMPLHERKLLALYWEASQVPANTSLEFAKHGETPESSWYVITSLADAVITLPNNQLQYQSTLPTPTPKNNVDPNERLYNRLVNENQQIRDYIAMLKAQQTTDVQKIQYDTTKNGKLYFAYSALFYIYYIVLFIAGYTIFMENASWPIAVKVVLAVVFILYPFVISTVEYYVAKYGYMGYSYIVGQPIGNDPVTRNIHDVSTFQRPYDGIVPLSNHQIPAL